jgi:glucose-1-phosphate thymidylyltransferase
MNSQSDVSSFPDTVGLIPAAGLAKRAGQLPCSKELFPIWIEDNQKTIRPVAACEILLTNMRLSGISRAHVILRKGKWDIPAYLGPGDSLGLSLSYFIMGLSFGVPYTLDQTYAHIRDSRIALGFPDILFDEAEAYRACLTRQSEQGADVVLGAFPADQPSQMDMIDVANGGAVRRILVKPARSSLELAWAIAVWTSSFTEFLHSFLARHRPRAEAAPELFIGDVIQGAIDRGMKVDAVCVSEKPFLDIGTPEGLLRSLSFSQSWQASQ